MSPGHQPPLATPDAEPESRSCPACHTSLDGDPVDPRVTDELGVAPTRLRRELGMILQGVWDGVLVWVCPDCGWAWPRAGLRPRHQAEAVSWVKRHNARADR